MSQQLLNHAQVGAALEEVRREGVAQPVWVTEEPPHRARVEPSPAHREEERVDRTLGQLGPSVAQVAGNVVGRLLSERHYALLAALSVHVHGLALEVHVCEVEPDGLGAS
jgi:hypothetical protein